MKKTNKGFSMVELIIVIAIMAILAGALAPSLIKYINKSRVSSDIQTASSIATACQTAIATEAGYDDATTSYSNAAVSLTAIYTGGVGTGDVEKEIKSVCGTNQPVLKAKKCNDPTGVCTHGGTYGGAGTSFEVQIDTLNNAITITESGGGHQLYPTPDACLE